ncbi:MAG: serine hydrolase [Clostridiales bacterium]|nr:MAG: serine hydrolase [Clostridiales bacterium]
MPNIHHANQGLNPNALEHVTQLLNRYVREKKVAGCSMYITCGGSEYRKNFGFADLAEKKPIADDTIFRIYSMSKPITVVAALMLYERGLFSLNDPLSAYIPEFAEQKVVLLDKAGNKYYETPKTPITIRHLFTMTSGLAWMEDSGPAAEEMGALMRSSAIEGKGTLEVAKLVARRVGLAFHPGEKWLYGYSHDVLGALICALTGKTFGEFLKEELFEPLGMEDTGFWVPRSKAERLANIYCIADDGSLQPAEGYTSGLFEPKLLESGGGGMLSTLGDYARFCRMLLNGGTLNGERILGRKTLELMAANQLNDHQLSYFKQGALGYGYGLGVRTMMNPACGGHNGSVGEYGWSGMAETWFCIDPAEDMAAVFMTQMIPGKFDPIPRLLPALYSALE